MAAAQDSLAPPQTALALTPKRGRSRTRYPLHLTRDLDPEGNPRPPLHRRGTSRTYETLEDLLTQAGYKETRIFTPEVDRRDAARDEEHHKENVPKEDETRGGVSGAVVKLLTTWMSTASRRAGTLRGAGKDGDGDGDDVHDVPPPSPLAHRSGAASTTRRKQSPPPPSTRNPAIPPALQQPQQQHSHPRPPLGASAAPNLQQPSRARTALRHVASAPQIDKRRQALAGRTQSGGRTSSRSNKAKARPPPPPPLPPPLPTNWLESISAALLLHTSPPSPASTSHPVAADRRGRLPSSMLATSGRAHASPGTITVTNVVCRSAPASRSPSVVRRQSRRASLRPPLPVLAQTAVFADDADCPAHSPHALPAAAAAAQDSDEDEEQELNLAMMLIPAKRQHSIRSLRSLLVQHSAQTNLSASASLSREYARMMRRRIEQADAEDAAAAAAGGGHWDSGEFLTARIKHRRSGLPNNWGWSS